MPYKWHPNQHRILAYAGDPHSELHCVGPTQSGKSFPLGRSFVLHIKAHDWPVDFDGFAMFGPRLATVRRMQRNLEAACKDMGVAFKKHGNGITYVDGYKIEPGFIANAESEGAWWGGVYGAVLIDEVTLCNKEMYQLAKGRANTAALGCDISKTFTATNPNSPHHWFKELIDRVPDRVVKSTIDDNPKNTEAWKEGLKRDWSGAMLARMYYGEWASHGGLVWPQFEQKCLQPAPPGKPSALHISVDDASQTVMHAIMWGKYPRHRRAVEECRYDGTREDWKSSSERAAMLFDWVGGRRRAVERIYVDPSATDLILDLRKLFGNIVEPAKNDVDAGIKQCHVTINRGQVSVDAKKCPHTVRECAAYSWDEKAEQRGEPDKPKKKDDHAADAFRYELFSETRRQAVVLRRW